MFSPCLRLFITLVFAINAQHCPPWDSIFKPYTVRTQRDRTISGHYQYNNPGILPLKQYLLLLHRPLHEVHYQCLLKCQTFQTTETIYTQFNNVVKYRCTLRRVACCQQRDQSIMYSLLICICIYINWSRSLMVGKHLEVLFCGFANIIGSLAPSCRRTYRIY